MPEQMVEGRYTDRLIRFHQPPPDHFQIIGR
jgi:hypothetical protein